MEHEERDEERDEPEVIEVTDHPDDCGCDICDEDAPLRRFKALREAFADVECGSPLHEGCDDCGSRRDRLYYA